MTEALLLLTLAAVTFPERWADISLLNNRLALWTCGAGLLLAWACPNPWLAVFIAASSINLMLRPHPSQPLKDSQYWPLALGALYVVLVPIVTPLTLTLFLWGLVALGLAQTCYLYWNINAGQGNPMHVQALAAIGLAASLGLGMQYHWLWIVSGVLALPIWLIQWRDTRMTLGPLYLLALAGGYLTLLYGWIVPMVGSVAVGGAFWWAWDKEPLWSGRKEWWTAGWTFFWTKGAWWQLLLGFGADAWITFSQRYLADIQQFSKAFVHHGFSHVVMPHAHNDYLQILFDRGLLGLGCLLGYLVTSLYALSIGTPDAQALFLVGVTLCAIAFGNFPWTGCVIAYLPDQKKLAGYGCPSLNYISWAVMVLVEVGRQA